MLRMLGPVINEAQQRLNGKPNKNVNPGSGFEVGSLDQPQVFDNLVASNGYEACQEVFDYDETKEQIKWHEVEEQVVVKLLVNLFEAKSSDKGVQPAWADRHKGCQCINCDRHYWVWLEDNQVNQFRSHVFLALLLLIHVLNDVLSKTAEVSDALCHVLWKYGSIFDLFFMLMASLWDLDVLDNLLQLRVPLDDFDLSLEVELKAIVLAAVVWIIYEDGMLGVELRKLRGRNGVSLIDFVLWLDDVIFKLVVEGRVLACLP